MTKRIKPKAHDLIKVSYTTNLRHLMNQAGYSSLEALSADSGISCSTLYRFEKCERLPLLDNLIKLLYILDCKFEDLICYQIKYDIDDGLVETLIERKVKKKAAEHKRFTQWWRATKEYLSILWVDK